MMSCLAAFPAKFSVATANNDLYVQLLAADGLLAGRGLGHYETTGFVSMVERPLSTRFAPGISLAAALLKWIGFDPLLTLVALYPLTISLTFIGIALALTPTCGARSAALISFASLTPLAALEWHHELGSEPFGLMIGAWLLCLVACGGLVSSMASAVRMGLAFVLLAWLMTLTRNATVLLIPGALAAYTLWKVKASWTARAGFFGTVLVLSLLPTLALIKIGGPPKEDYVPLTGATYLRQLNSDVRNLYEVTAPRILGTHHRLAALIGWSILAVLLAVYLRILAGRQPCRVPSDFTGPAAAACMAASYMVLQALGSAKSGGDINSYRVAGFALPWAAAGFWGTAVAWSRCRMPKGRVPILAALVLISGARFAYAVRYETLTAAQRTLNDDYRRITHRVRRAVEELPDQGSIAVYTRGSPGRNLYYMLLYFDRNEGSLPWAVERWTPDSRAEIVLVLRKDLSSAEVQGQTTPVDREGSIYLVRGGFR
jgi:hypothetical protein